MRATCIRLDTSSGAAIEFESTPYQLRTSTWDPRPASSFIGPPTMWVWSSNSGCCCRRSRRRPPANLPLAKLEMDYEHDPFGRHRHHALARDGSTVVRPTTDRVSTGLNRLHDPYESIVLDLPPSSSVVNLATTLVASTHVVVVRSRPIGLFPSPPSRGCRESLGGA